MEFVAFELEVFTIVDEEDTAVVVTVDTAVTVLPGAEVVTVVVRPAIAPVARKAPVTMTTIRITAIAAKIVLFNLGL